MNINNPTTFGTPNLTLSTSNSSGTGGALRADDTILIYDATVPTTIASGASAAVGDVATAARRNHTHGMYTATAAASEAEEKAASSTTAFTSPGRQKFHPAVAKVWGKVEMTGAHSLLSDYNMTSATDVGVGQSNIVYDIDFSDNDSYTLTATASDSTNVTFNAVVAGGASVLTRDSDTGALEDVGVFYGFAGFGEQ